MTATINEIQDQVKTRYAFFKKTLLTLSEEDLNTPPLASKRSIGEIIEHVIRLDGVPLFGKIMFYYPLNILTGLVNKANRKPLDASDYKWNLERTIPRRSNFISKEKLWKNCSDTYSRVWMYLRKAQDKDRRILHYTERHANMHLKQIQVLLEITEP
jgi:hypothetical protein